MILKFAIYGSLLLHVLFFILFYVVSIFKKCYFRLFSARYFCIEFKSYQKCQLRRFLFISVSVRSNFFCPHAFGWFCDDVTKFSLFQLCYFCACLYFLFVLDRHFDLVFRAKFSIYFNLLTSRFRMIGFPSVQVATICEFEFKIAQSELYLSARKKPLSVRHRFLTWHGETLGFGESVRSSIKYQIYYRILSIQLDTSRAIKKVKCV